MQTPETLPTKIRPTHPALLPWRASWDLQLVLLGLLLLLAVAALRPLAGWLAPLHLLLGFACVLYLPGYCLQAALFPRHDDLDQIERASLSMGVSVALATLLALVLNALPWGLQPTPLLIGQSLLVAVLGMLAYWRRATTFPTTTPAPTATPTQWWQQQNRTARAVLVSSVGVLLTLAIALLWAFAVPTPDRPRTEFYVLGSEGQASGYPHTAAVGEQLSVTLGIANHDPQPQTYRVEVWATWAWEPETYLTPLAELGPLTVPPDETVELPVTWAMPWSADDAQVSMRLYRAGDSQAYRELLLWLDVLPASE